MAKIGVVGAGFVGSTAAYAIVLGNLAGEVVLVDLDEAKASAQARDIKHATPFSHPSRVLAGGYSDLAGSALVIIAAGVNQKPGETRMDLIAKNVQVFADVVPRVVEATPDSVLVVATNPVDVLTHIAWKQSGLPSERVIGSGTTLDTARLRAMVGERAGVSSHNVHGYVLGEHGDTEMVAWSTVSIGGLGLKQFFAGRSTEWNAQVEEALLEDVRRAAYEIIEGKGATYYGVAAALARIAEAILQDEHSLLTVAVSDGEVAYSLPRIVGREGVIRTLEVQLTPGERAQLDASIAAIRKAIEATDA
jgi:L-lactate dehydrogenase